MQEGNDAATAWEKARSYTYDALLTGFTQKWYHTILTHLPENTRLLAVGIGTGTALLANASLIQSKELHIHGIDTDDAYVKQGQQLIETSSLQQNVTVTAETISQLQGQQFDHACFCGSFMLLPDPVATLREVSALLADRQNSRVFFAHTLEMRKNRILEWLKPRLTVVTSVDFGHVTYEEDFEEKLVQAGFCTVFSQPVDDGRMVEGVRESRVVCARRRLPEDQMFETVV